MNKKQAIAYAQITLDYMNSSRYTGKITPEKFGVEMQCAFKIYSRGSVVDIANAQIEAYKKTGI